MSADFTPGLSPYKETGTFRFWCQKVLPLVYDDSLSYYELLCKVVNYLNDVISNVDGIRTDTEALRTAYIELQDYVNSYFDNLNVQEQINTKLDEMAEDGTLSGLINPLIPNAVSDWLEDNLDPTTPPVDATLSISGAAADAKVTGDRITDLSSAINFYGITDFNKMRATDTKANNGIDYSYSADTDSYSASGTATGLSVYNFIAENPFSAITAGKTYHIVFSSSDPTNVYLQIYCYYGNTLTLLKQDVFDEYITIPETATGCLFRARTKNNATVNATVTFNIYGTLTPDELFTLNNAQMIVNSVDDFTENETGKTDMSSIIMSELSTKGYCKLGEGVFYVSGIDMPANSTLEGSGEKTIIKLLDSVIDGYAVQIHSYNTVANLSIVGNYSDITVETYGHRTGLGFIGNYDGTDAGNAYQTNHCMISNLWIRNFSDSGLKCHNTSINYAKGLYSENVYIYNCHIGINIDYYSEFNKFTNTCIVWCWYACINNGGNNVFTACTFHATNTGFYIDGTKPNSGHGTLNGCTFCHIGSNSGVALKIRNEANGFLINACQFWYNSVSIDESSGIVFSNCEFGRGTTGTGATIYVSNGETVLFIGCIFMNDSTYPPDIHVTSNTKTKFVDCYGSVTGNEISA